MPLCYQQWIDRGEKRSKKDFLKVDIAVDNLLFWEGRGSWCGTTLFVGWVIF